MVQKQNLINLNWKPTPMEVEPFSFSPNLMTLGSDDITANLDAK